MSSFAGQNTITQTNRNKPKSPEEEEIVALPYVKKRIKQNLKVSKTRNMMRKKQNLFSAFSGPMRVCAFINHLQGISFDDDSDEDADWKKQSLDETEVRTYF